MTQLIRFGTLINATKNIFEENVPSIVPIVYQFSLHVHQNMLQLFYNIYSQKYQNMLHLVSNIFLLQQYQNMFHLVSFFAMYVLPLAGSPTITMICKNNQGEVDHLHNEVDHLHNELKAKQKQPLARQLCRWKVQSKPKSKTPF